MADDVKSVTPGESAAAPGEAGPSRTSALAPFSVPIFRSIWIASMIANFGMLFQAVGASWMMISLDDSPKMVALVQSTNTLPIMLLSLLAGAMADNVDRRIIMLAAQIFMLVISAALAVTAWLGLLTPWLLLGFTFLVGCGTAMYLPAWQASVGEMVPRALLPGAVAMNSMGFNMARSIGPAFGGMIVALWGAASTFLLNALSYIGVIRVLWGWRPERPPRLLPREEIGQAMLAGVRYVVLSPTLWRVMLRGCLFGLAGSAVPAMMPLVAYNLLRGGALTYGLLLGAFGIGAVIGAFSTSRLRRHLSTENIVRSGILAMAVGAMIAGSSRMMPFAMAGLIVAGAGWVLTLSSFNVTVQLSSPRWVVARALSLYQMFTFGGMAGGAWIAGIIAQQYNVSVALFAAGGMAVAGLLIGRWFPLPELQDVNLDPLANWNVPQNALTIQPRSGPIIVNVEYRISAADIPQFLILMHERHRIRRRDGARSWSLQRDLAEPDLWIERYELPTWTEYVRHNQRRTQADLANFEAARALHIGPDLPIVRRRIERQTSSLPGAHELASAATDPSGRH
ncbi:MAG: MFS transporter [Sphingomonadaceae bacterium]